MFLVVSTLRFHAASRCQGTKKQTARPQGHQIRPAKRTERTILPVEGKKLHGGTRLQIYISRKNLFRSHCHLKK